MSVSSERSQELTEKLESVLSQFGEEHGVVVSVEGVEFHTPEVARTFAYVKNAEAMRFGEKAQKYGLSDQDYRRELKVGGKTMYLVDCRPNRYRYPFVAEDIAGKRWRVTAEMARQKI